jgi:hypothetical protein
LSSAFPSDLESAMRAITSAQQRATAAGVCLRDPPIVPTTCCGRGCSACVWGFYFDALAWWLEDAAKDT